MRVFLCIVTVWMASHEILAADGTEDSIRCDLNAWFVTVSNKQSSSQYDVTFECVQTKGDLTRLDDFGPTNGLNQPSPAGILHDLRVGAFGQTFVLDKGDMGRLEWSSTFGADWSTNTENVVSSQSNCWQYVSWRAEDESVSVSSSVRRGIVVVGRCRAQSADKVTFEGSLVVIEGQDSVQTIPFHVSCRLNMRVKILEKIICHKTGGI